MSRGEEAKADLVGVVFGGGEAIVLVCSGLGAAFRVDLILEYL